MSAYGVWGKKPYRVVYKKMMVKESVFLVISAIELTMGLLDNCNVVIPMSRYILWIFLLYYGVMVVAQEHKRWEWILLIFLLGGGVLLYLNSGLNIGIKLPLYLYAMRDIDKEKYCKMVLLVLLGVTVCTAVAAKWSDFGSMYFESGYDRGIGGYRYCLGYANPNRATGLVLMAMIFGLAAFGGKMSWKTYALSAAAFTILYLFTDSRTSYYIGMVMLAGGFVLKRIHGTRVCRAIFVCTLIILFGMLLISFGAACHIDNDFMRLVNKIISGRMNQLADYTGDERYVLPYIENWHLFGSRENHNGYDMGYVQLFYYYGVIPGICYVAFIVLGVVRAWKNQNDLFILLILGLCVFLFMEDMYFSNFVPMHFVMTFAAVIICNRNKEGTDT